MPGLPVVRSMVLTYHPSPFPGTSPLSQGAASTHTHVDTQPSTLGHQPSGSEPPEGASETPRSPSGEGREAGGPGGALEGEPDAERGEAAEFFPSATLRHPTPAGPAPRSHWAQGRAVPPGPRPRGGRGGAWRGRDGSPSIRRFLQVRSTWCQASSRAVDSRWNGIRCSCTPEIPPKKSGGAICSEQAQHKRAPCFPLRPGEVQSSPTPWSWRQPGCRSTTSQLPGPKRQTLGDARLCHREP